MNSGSTNGKKRVAGKRKADLVAISVQMPCRVLRLIDRLIAAAELEGRSLSRADVIRDWVAAAIEARKLRMDDEPGPGLDVVKVSAEPLE